VVDWRKASRGFVFADLNPAEGAEITRGSFKMPLCYVEGGELVAIGNAINNALARISQVEDIAETARADGLAALQTMQGKLQAESAADTLPGAEIVADAALADLHAGFCHRRKHAHDGRSRAGDRRATRAAH
jgi:hypothetical protein